MTTPERWTFVCISRGLLAVPRSLAIGCDKSGVPFAPSTLALQGFWNCGFCRKAADVQGVGLGEEHCWTLSGYFKDVRVWNDVVWTGKKNDLKTLVNVTSDVVFRCFLSWWRQLLC
ncbi:hypothetical protein CDAR_495591 [Caerostris darwini]|uniref:Uncharacterized protein n=1 Tax=Caerostris darwini TaxID=1538125 RepID=A0AAV4S8H4_9ARAC|nr:hypothetical protein CDAR_495591 [Caerostris darwini]